MIRLRRRVPGAKVTVQQQQDGVTVDRAGEQVHLPREIASRVFVTAA